MTFIKGSDSIFFIKDDDNLWYPVSCETSNSMSEQSSVISTTTRDNEGWETSIPTNQNYSFSLDCVMINDFGVDGLSYFKIRNKKRNRQLIEWKRKYITIDKEETGKGYITDISDTHSVDDNITFTLTIQGFGAPNEVTNHLGGDVNYPNGSLRLGGRNLILNSTNDDTIPLYGVTATRENIVDNTLPSKNYFKFTNVVRADENYAFYIPTNNNPEKFSQSLIGKKIQISFYIRTNNSQKLVFERDANQNFMTDGNWQRVSFNTIFNGGNLHFLLEGAGLSSFDISSVKIEFGDLATLWTPAPEDIII